MTYFNPEIKRQSEPKKLRIASLGDIRRLRERRKVEFENLVNDVCEEVLIEETMKKSTETAK